MKIAIEISYYAFQSDYNKVIEKFIFAIEKNKKIELNSGEMSSIVSGDYKAVMELLQKEMKPFLEKYPSVFFLKISNACPACETG